MKQENLDKTVQIVLDELDGINAVDVDDEAREIVKDAIRYAIERADRLHLISIRKSMHE